jgi:hypothetical protein
MEQQKEHEFCLRCGRKLKNPEARLIGMGKVCLQKSKSQENKSRLFENFLKK